MWNGGIDVATVCKSSPPTMQATIAGCPIRRKSKIRAVATRNDMPSAPKENPVFEVSEGSEDKKYAPYALGASRLPELP